MRAGLSRAKVVWEYVSPYLAPSPPVPAPGQPPAKSNWTYRVQGVPLAGVPQSQSGGSGK